MIISLDLYDNVQAMTIPTFSFERRITTMLRIVHYVAAFVPCICVHAKGGEYEKPWIDTTSALLCILKMPHVMLIALLVASRDCTRNYVFSTHVHATVVAVR